MSDLPVVRREKMSNWSAIWILPLVALAIGVWLLWRAYSMAGVTIHIQFDSGEGIQVNKTMLVFKGIPIGKVVGLEVAKDLQSVTVAVEVNKAAESYLGKNSRFWLVKPRVSLAGITGLETLVSGSYIAIEPVTSENMGTHFVALKSPPPLAETLPGLHITLKADRLGSLDQGSPVFYKQVQVGQVKDYKLAEDQKTIELNVLIEPAYQHLVRKHTRFWNAGGITFSGGLSGFRFHVDSLMTLAAGGIAFDLPAGREDSPPTDPTKPFRLYDDFDAAQAGIKVLLRLSNVSGLTPGQTPIIYNGMQVGILKNLDMDADLQNATAELRLDPRTEDFLNSKTGFWIAQPTLSLAGATGLDSLLKGTYIGVHLSKEGAPERNFTIRPKAPPLNMDAPGLHLVLTSDTLSSVAVGSPVLFRQMSVGSVQSYQLSKSGKTVVIGIHIEPEYAKLINTSTRFWNASGISLRAGLSGVEVKSESLQTLLLGGIAFDTPDPAAQPITRIKRFSLYADRAQAMQKGTLIRIRMPATQGLETGASIKFKGLQVGKVESIRLTDDLKAVEVEARITEAEDRIARQGSQFWLVGPELGLTKTANLGTLITGPYLEVLPAQRSGGPATVFKISDGAPDPKVESLQGLRLVLSAARRLSIKPDVPVTYREIQVGKVVSVDLSPTAQRVLVTVLIEPRYTPLVRSGSQFWNSSGVGVDASLFKGVKVRTESLETLISGGIAFATPDGVEMGERVDSGRTFTLFEGPREEWLRWAPTIPLGEHQGK